MSSRPRRRIHLVIKARQSGDAAKGLRQVAAAVEGAALDAHVELDLSGPDMTNAAKDARLTDQVTAEVGGVLDELATAVKMREQEAQAGRPVPPPKNAAETKTTLVRRVETFTRASGRVLVAVKGLADIIVSTFNPKL